MVKKSKPGKFATRRRKAVELLDLPSSSDTLDLLSPFSDESTLSEFTTSISDVYSTFKSDQYSLLQSDFTASVSNDLSFLNSREFTSTKSPDMSRSEMYKKKLVKISNDEDKKSWINSNKRWSPTRSSIVDRVSIDETCNDSPGGTKSNESWTPDRGSIAETCNELKNLTQNCEPKGAESKNWSTKCHPSMCQSDKRIADSDSGVKSERSKEEKVVDKCGKRKLRKKKGGKSNICQNICSRLLKLTDTSNDDVMAKREKPSFRKFKKEKKSKKEPNTLSKIVGESYRVLRKLSGFGLGEKKEKTEKEKPKPKGKRKLSDTCLTWVNESVDKERKDHRLSDSCIDVPKGEKEGFCFSLYRTDWRRGNEFLKDKLGKYCCKNKESKAGKSKEKCKKIENICAKKGKQRKRDLHEPTDVSCGSVESEQLRNKIAILQEIINRKERKKRKNVGENPRIKMLRKLGKGDLTTINPNWKDKFGQSLVPYKRALIESTKWA